MMGAGIQPCSTGKPGMNGSCHGNSIPWLCLCDPVTAPCVAAPLHGRGCMPRGQSTSAVSPLSKLATWIPEAGKLACELRMDAVSYSGQSTGLKASLLRSFPSSTPGFHSVVMDRGWPGWPRRAPLTIVR